MTFFDFANFQNSQWILILDVLSWSCLKFCNFFYGGRTTQLCTAYQHFPTTDCKNCQSWGPICARIQNQFPFMNYSNKIEFVTFHLLWKSSFLNFFFKMVVMPSKLFDLIYKLIVTQKSWEKKSFVIRIWYKVTFCYDSIN